MIRRKFGLSQYYIKRLYTYSHSNSMSTAPLSWTFEPPGRREVPFKKTRNKRLLNMAETFKKRKNLQCTGEMLHSMYSDELFSIFEDLQSYPKWKRHLAPILCRGFTRFKPMKGFYLEQLMRCIKNSNYCAFLMGMAILENSGMLSNYERVLLFEVESAVKDLREILGTKSNLPKADHDLKLLCLEILVLTCVTTGEPLFAASYALHAKDLALKLKQETLELVIFTLSVHDPLYHNYNAFSIFRLMETYKFVYSSSMLLDVIWNLASGRNPYFANLLFDKLDCPDKLFKVMPSSYKRSVKALVLANMKFGNYHRAGSLWKLCFDLDPTCGEKNRPIFQALLENTAHPEHAEDLFLYRCSESLYSHPDFVNFALSYSGKRQKLHTRTKFFTELLKPPLERSVLSQLFSAFISQDREETAEDILRVILKTRSGINAEDFLVIISKLLTKNQLKQCVQMCLRSEFIISKKGSMKVFEYLLAYEECTETVELESMSYEDYKKLKNTFLFNLITNLHKENSDISLYQSLTATIFKHFSAHISNRATRKLYSKISYCINKSESSLPCLSSYNFPSGFEKFLVINDGNRVQCLEIILEQANEQRDLAVKNWCVKELQIAGMPIKDIHQFYL